MNGGALEFSNGTVYGLIQSDADGNIQFQGSGGSGTCTISGLADSSAADGLVTKSYVDNIAGGIHSKDTAYVSTQSTVVCGEAVVTVQPLFWMALLRRAA